MEKIEGALGKILDLGKDLTVIQRQWKRLNEDIIDLKAECSQLSAMLADIAEIIFGGSMNDKWKGINTPSCLSLAHAGWACNGFIRKSKNQSYFDLVKNMDINSRDEWHIFLDILKDVTDGLKESKEA